MDGFIEEAFASTLGGLAIAGIRFNVGDHARIEHALAMVRRIKATIEVERGACEVQTNMFGDLLQGLQPLRQQDHIRLIDGCHRQGSSHRAMVVRDRNDLLALLVFVPRVPNPISPFLATVLVPSPWSTRRSSVFSSARWATLAVNACQSDPSSAHLAKTL